MAFAGQFHRYCAYSIQKIHEFSSITENHETYCNKSRVSTAIETIQSCHHPPANHNGIDVLLKASH
jgi:hypothetical protein